GHHYARQQERPAEAEINQTGNETAPVIGQLFADQKDKRGRGHYGERDRQPSRCLIYPENLVRRDDQPVEQRRFFQNRYSVVGWEQPLMALDHLARCSGILAFGLAVEVAGANGHDVQQRRQRNQDHQQSVARGRRRQRRRVQQRFFNG